MAGCGPRRGLLGTGLRGGPGRGAGGPVVRHLRERRSGGCELLAPLTLEDLEGDDTGSCPRLLPEQGLPESSAARGVEVFGKDAIVRLDRDTLFLARFEEGWRVTAAGCTANGDRPYDCVVKGG